MGKNQKLVCEELLDKMDIIGDVTFLVGPNEEQVKCFIFLLRSLSPVFNIMFDEKWKSKDQEQVVKLPDCDAKMFCVFLKLLVMDNLNLEILNNLEITMDQVLLLFYIADKYDVSKIQIICRIFIRDNMAVYNVAFIYEMLQTRCEPELEELILRCMASTLDQVVYYESFYAFLSIGSWTKILSQDKLTVDEVVLFQKLFQWAIFQCERRKLEKTSKDVRETMGHLLFLIRFPIIPRKDFFERVVPTGILSEEEISGVLHYLDTKDKEEQPVVETPFDSRPRQMAMKFWCVPFLKISGFTRDDVSELALYLPLDVFDEEDPSKNLMELSVTMPLTESGVDDLSDGTEIAPTVAAARSRVDAFQTNVLRFKWSDPFDLKTYHTFCFRTPFLRLEMKNCSPQNFNVNFVQREKSSLVNVTFAHY